MTLKTSKVLFLFALFLTAGSAYAMGPKPKQPAPLHTEAECGDADPLAQKPEPLQAFFRTPRDQGSMGTCYAEAAADLATFAIGTPISALDLNFVYEGDVHQNLISQYINADLGKRGFYQGGSIPGSIASGASAGFCPESITPSSDEIDGTRVEILQLTLQTLKNERNNPDGFVAGLADADVSGIFPELASKEVPADVMAIARSNLNDAMKTLALKACPADARLQLPENVVTSDRVLSSGWFSNVSVSDLISALDQAIDQEKTIAAITIHANPIVVKGLQDADKGADEHAVIIQGRHWADGQCWYTVRNSWGYYACDSYALDQNSLHCDPNTQLAMISEAKLREILIEVTNLNNTQ